MSGYIYLPMEIKSREYMAKYILALELADRGYQVISGKSAEVEKLCLFGPPGLYIGTSLMKQHYQLFERLKKRGHCIAAVDEEGLVYYNKDSFLRTKVDANTLSILSVFFTWGEHHTKLVAEKCPESFPILKQVGNVRMELLKEPYRRIFCKEANTLTEKYGRFILINTNFGAFNHYKGIEAYWNSLSHLVDMDSTLVDVTEKKLKHQERIFYSFADMANKIAAEFPDYQIILRPHPSESIERWQDQFHYPNIEVVHEGSVIPWIIASDCIIQQNCTTAIEARCLDKPVFSFLPDYDSNFDSGLPNKVAPCFKDCEELIAALHTIAVSPEQYETMLKEKTNEVLTDYIENMKNERNAFDDCALALEGLTLPTPKAENWGRVRALRWLYEQVSLALNQKKREQRKYIEHKFPSTPEEEWNAQKELFAELFAPKYRNITLLRLSENGYLLRKNQ